MHKVAFGNVVAAAKQHRVEEEEISAHAKGFHRGGAFVGGYGDGGVAAIGKCPQGAAFLRFHGVFGKLLLHGVFEGIYALLVGARRFRHKAGNIGETLAGISRPFFRRLCIFKGAFHFCAKAETAARKNYKHKVKSHRKLMLFKPVHSFFHLITLPPPYGRVCPPLWACLRW